MDEKRRLIREIMNKVQTMPIKELLRFFAKVRSLKKENDKQRVVTKNAKRASQN